MAKSFLFGLFFMLLAGAAGAQQLYVKFDGISGDQTGVHTGEFLASAYQNTDTIPVNIFGGGGSGTGKAFFGGFDLQKPLVPAAHPLFMKQMLQSRKFSTVTLTWYNTADAPYLQITLSDVSLQSLSTLSPACPAGNCSNLYEVMRIVPSKVEWKDPVSGTRFGWNIVTNTAF